MYIDGGCVFYFFFFKQKTAYEMRISDWSSDVCSSDLFHAQASSRRGCMVTRMDYIVLQYIYSDWRSWVMARNGRLTIGDLSRRTGTKVQTIRYYEQIGLLPEPARSRDRKKHTSELQSLMRISYAVFCLKKKKHQQ